MADEWDSVPSPLDDNKPAVKGAAKSAAAPAARDEFDAIPSPLDDAHAAVSSGEPLTTTLGGYLHLPAYLAQETAKGAAETIALPRSVLGIINSVTGRPQDQGVPSWLPSSADVAQHVQNSGLNTLSPQDSVERYGGAAARGVGATIPTLPLGGEGILANLGTGGAAGVGAELGKFLSPDSWWGPVLGGVAAGLSGGKAVSLLSSAADARSAAAELARQNAKLAVLSAAKSEAASAKSALAIPHELATQAATDQLRDVQDAQRAAVSEQVRASGALRDVAVSAAKDQIDASKATLGQTLGDISARQTTASQAAETAALVTKQQAKDQLGALAAARTAETDPDRIGSVVQAAGHNFLSSTLPKYEEAVWSPVNAALNGVETPIEHFLDRVEAIGGRGGELANVVSRFSPNIGQALRGAVGKFRPAETEAGALPDALPEAAPVPPPVPTWQDVRQLRSAIGEAKSNPMVLRDVGEQNLDSLYQATTQDLRETAAAHGAETPFDLANSTSSRLRQFAEGPIASLVKGAKPSPEDLAPGKLVNGLLSDAKATGTTLSALRAEPSTAAAVDELAGHVLSSDPKLWQGLSPGAKVALVPDAAERTAIEQAHATLAADAPKFSSAPFDVERQAAQAAHEARAAQAQQLISGANDAHKQSVAAARDSAAQALRAQQRANQDLAAAQRLEMKTHAARLDELESRVSDVKSAIAQAKAGGSADATSILHGVEALVSAHVGEPVAEMATHALGLIDPTGTLAFANPMIAAALPWAYRATKNLLSHPGRAAGRAGRGAAVGAVTQPNPLSDTAP